jgi:hypothetical protein
LSRKGILMLNITELTLFADASQKTRMRHPIFTGWRFRDVGQFAWISGKSGVVQADFMPGGNTVCVRAPALNY